VIGVQSALSNGESNPDIPQPYQSEEYREGFFESPLAGVDKENHEAIMKANLKLFQLVRPEKLFMNAAVSENYKRFALLAQEHFSAVVFLKMVVNALKNRINQSVNLNAESFEGDVEIAKLPREAVVAKWCIYTRTSPELLFLSDKHQGGGMWFCFCFLFFFLVPADFKINSAISSKLMGRPSWSL
jgi:hypothetical protein